MAISLKKGGVVNLTQKEPTLKKILIGLGWEVKPGNAIDLDASVFMLDSAGKVPAEEYFVFYNNLKSPDGSIQHTGDNRTGAGDDDDEMVLTYIDKIDSNIKEIVIVASVHQAEKRKHNFGLLTDAYIRIVNIDTNQEILRFDLDAEYPESTDVEFGRLKNVEGEWTFVASGISSNKGLQGYVDTFV